MFSIYCTQYWYNVSDHAMEDALYEISPMRLFAEVIEKISKSDGSKLVKKAKCYRFSESNNKIRVTNQTQYEG